MCWKETAFEKKNCFQSEKREVLRELLRRRKERKIVVFTQSAQTTEELRDEFSSGLPLFMVGCLFVAGYFFHASV